MANTNTFRPVQMPELLVLFGFAGIIGCARYYRWTSGSARSSKKAKRLTFEVLLTFFLLIAGLNAFLNHRLGLPQF